ncbi:hypothetical protein VTL71DRAFT_6537, partial [Oculimacula yallundae]
MHPVARYGGTDYGALSTEWAPSIDAVTRGYRRILGNAGVESLRTYCGSPIDPSINPIEWISSKKRSAPGSNQTREQTPFPSCPTVVQNPAPKQIPRRNL